MRSPNRRSRRAALAVAAVATVFAASACTSSDDGNDGEGPDVDLSALGEPQKASGSSVKVGLITDGGLAGSSSDPSADMARATVKYLNDYRNGLNGHVIELVDCETGNVPSGGTACGSQMVEEDVIAAILPTSTQDVSVFPAIKGSGVPYITNRSAVPDILADPNSFMLTNPNDAFDSIFATAESEGITSIGMPIIDVPAATEVVKALVQPQIDEAGLKLIYTPIGPSVADQTPQIVQMIDQGAELFLPVGTTGFVASTLKALKQNNFGGPIQIGINPITDDFVAAVPGGLAGVTNINPITGDPADPDIQLYNAIGTKYEVDGFEDASVIGFTNVMSFAVMIEGLEGDLTKETVSAWLGDMPEPVDRPMAPGSTLQCGVDLNPAQPAVCTLQAFKSELDKDGNATSWEVFG